jgi:hypothetical protein
MGLADRDYMRRHPELLYDDDEPLVLLDRPGIGSLVWQTVAVALLGLVIVAVLSSLLGWVGALVVLAVAAVVGLRRAWRKG